MSGNSGISFGGNARISNSAVAAGENARAHNVASSDTDGSSELNRRVEEMIALLDAEVAQGRLTNDVAAAGHEVSSQLSAEEPNWSIVKTLLAGIQASAGPLTAVAGVVGAVQKLL